MASSPPEIFPTEAVEEALLRLVKDFSGDFAGGAAWNTRPGSLIHAIFQPVALDNVKILDFGQLAFGLGFLQWAEGGYLDAKALEFGMERHGAVSAKVDVTFVGDVGTLIPAGQAVSTEGSESLEGIVFLTDESGVIDLTGVAVLAATAEIPGRSGNIASGDITIMVDAIAGITDVYNEQPSSGGLDVQSDESLRAEVLERARRIPQGGNRDTLFTLAITDPEVSNVYVKDFWDTSNGLDGNGTVLLVLGGEEFAYVSPAAVERVQSLIDPTVRPIAHMESETWTNAVSYTTEPLEGKASIQVTTTSGGTVTSQLTLSPKADITAWDDDDDEVWLWVRRLSGTSTFNNIKVRLMSSLTDYYEYTISTADITAVASTIATSGGHLFKMPKSGFVATGNPNWDLNYVQILTAAASGQIASFVYDGLRVVRKYGGFPAGGAPIFVQVTVKSARTLLTDISVTIYKRTGLEEVNVTADIREALSSLLRSKQPGEKILISEVANTIFDLEGVEDYSSILINGVAANLVVPDDQRPELDDLVITYA